MTTTRFTESQIVQALKDYKAGQDKRYKRIRCEGIKWNYKRVRRVYLAMGIKHRQRTKRRVPKREKQPLVVPIGRNMCWSMDFMHDSLMNKRRFRVFNVIDDYNRQALMIEADFSFPSHAVVRMLERALREYGKPAKIRVDNGPAFPCSIFVNWCSQHGIIIQYIQPGRPLQNVYIERFHRTFRQDVLEAYVLEDLYQFRETTEEWMEDYNNHKPHESLNNHSPVKYCKT